MATKQLMLLLVLLGSVYARDIAGRSQQDIMSDIRDNYMRDTEHEEHKEEETRTTEPVYNSPVLDEIHVGALIEPEEEVDERETLPVNLFTPQQRLEREVGNIGDGNAGKKDIRKSYSTSENKAVEQAPLRSSHKTSTSMEDFVDGVQVKHGYDYYSLAEHGHATTVKHKMKTIRSGINDYAADYYRIMLERFDTNISIYNPYMMPFRHDKSAATTPNGQKVVYEEIDVKIKFSPYSLVELDEKGMTMTMVGEFWLIWSEKMLQFQEEASVWTITVTKDMVWTPPILISNGVDGGEGIGSADDTISLTRIGYLQWRTKQMLKTSCDIIVTNFPFDSQRCDIVITSPPDMAMEFILWGEEGSGFGIDMDKFNQDGSWELVGNNSFLYNYIEDTKNLELTYTFLFRRRPLFYIFSTILPVLLLSLTSSLVFVLPVDAGEKMGTGITIVLAYAVYLTIVSDVLPDSSVNVCIISVYLILLLTFSAFGVVCSAFLLRLYFKPENEPVPKSVRSLTRFLQTMLLMKLKDHINPETEDDDQPEDEDDDKRQEKRKSDEGMLAYINPTGFSDIKEKQAYYDNNGFENQTEKAPIQEEEEESTSTTGSFEMEKHDMCWNDVAKTLDWFFYNLFSVLTLLSTIVCFAITYFDLMNKTPTLESLSHPYQCDAIEFNILESGRTQWQNYDKTNYPLPLCAVNRTWTGDTNANI